jgi:hypothetical protein
MSELPSSRSVPRPGWGAPRTKPALVPAYDVPSTTSHYTTGLVDPHFASGGVGWSVAGDAINATTTVPRSPETGRRDAHLARDPHRCVTGPPRLTVSTVLKGHSSSTTPRPRASSSVIPLLSRYSTANTAASRRTRTCSASRTSGRTRRAPTTTSRRPTIASTTSGQGPGGRPGVERQHETRRPGRSGLGRGTGERRTPMSCMLNLVVSFVFVFTRARETFVAGVRVFSRLVEAVRCRQPGSPHQWRSAS